MNIYDTLVNSAKCYPNKVAVTALNKDITYRSLYHYASSIANQLKRYDEKGARVVVYLEDSIETVVSIYGINMAGMIFVPVSPQVRDQKLQEIVEHSNASIIITQPKLFEFVSSLIDQNPCDCKHIVLLGEDSSDDHKTRSYQVDYVKASNNHTDFVLETWNEDEMTAIFYMTDKSGKPKGIMLSSKNILSNMEAIIEYLKMSNTDNLLILKSLALVGTVTGEIIASMAVGAHIVIFSGLNHAGIILKAIQEYQITGFFAVPVMLHMIVEYRRSKKYSTASLRYIQIGAAKLSKEDVLQLMDMYPGVDLYYIYGVSEASPRVLHLKPNDMLKKAGSVGTPVKYCSVCLRDANEQVVDTGKIGELYVQGPNVMLGYYRSPELTKEKLTEYGLKTGDLAYKDEDQYVYLCGRADNMINQGGVHIYPAEVELNILRCNKVKEVKVEGVADELLGTKIKVIVTPIEGTDLTEAEVYDFCLEHMESMKIPKLIEITK